MGNAVDDVNFTRAFVTRFHTLDNLHDTDGRPLGEGHASAKAREGVELVTAPCPFPGSRNGKPMNISTLLQLKNAWPDVMGSMAEVNRGYLAQQGRAQASNWIDALGCTVACLCLPAYLHGRADKPIEDGELPVIAAALYKVAIGALAVVTAMLGKHIREPDNAATATVDPEAVVDFAEKSGRLVGAELACSGAFWRLIEAMTAILAPDDATRSDHFAAMVTDRRGFFAIANAATAQLVYAQLFELVDLWAELRLLAGFVAREPERSTDPDDLGLRVHDHLEGATRLHSEAALRETIERLLQLAEETQLFDVAPVRSYLQRSGQLQPDPSFAALVRSSTARAIMSDATIDWWVSEAVSYGRFRSFYHRELQRLETLIADALGRQVPAIKLNNRTLYPRAHAHAWLEAVAGLRILIDDGRLVAQFRDHSVAVEL